MVSREFSRSCVLATKTPMGFKVGVGRLQADYIIGRVEIVDKGEVAQLNVFLRKGQSYYLEIRQLIHQLVALDIDEKLLDVLNV